MGNVCARLRGIANDRPPVVMGSHVGSLENGGRVDGVLGVLTALEVGRTMVENGITARGPVGVAGITNEEGARFEPSLMASGVISGRFDKSNMLKSTDKSGVTFGEALKNSRYEGKEENRLKEASAFLELHIEQGPVLETESLQI